MKNLVVSFAIVFAAVSAFAVNSISVNVDGVNYACTPGADSAVDCEAKVSVLVYKLNVCSGGGYGAMTCIDKVWPSFKTANPSCVEEGSRVCIERCQTGGYSAITCLDKCQ